MVPYAAGLAVLLLSACTGGTETPPPTSSMATSASSTAPPTTSASATPTTTTSASATPTTTDPVLARIPKAARPETMQGAEAFARFYVSQMNAAFTEADRQALSGLYESTCTTCQNFYDTASRFKTEGLRHSKSSFTVRSATASSFTAQSRVVNAFVEQTGVAVVDKDGAVTGRTKSAEGVFVISLKFSVHWTIARLQTARS